MQIVIECSLVILLNFWKINMTDSFRLLLLYYYFLLIKMAVSGIYEENNRK